MAAPIYSQQMQQAHDRTGHTYAEALKHLPDVCSDIEAVEGEHDPNCPICKQHNAKQLVSRRTPVRAHRPFYRLCWDVIPMRDGFVSQMYFLGFHYVERVYSTKAGDLVSHIRKCVNTCKRRWSFEVIFIGLS
jgi:hypothetical protein